MQQSSMFKFMERCERPSTSQYPNFSKEFTSTRCDSVLAVDTPSDHTDIGCFESYAAMCKLNSEQRFQILTNPYNPPLNFKFLGRAEKCGCQRCFWASWLLRYSWLEYSVQGNGVFCVPCILFGVGPGGVDLGVLVSR